MPLVKTVHMGGITLGNETVFTVIRGKRQLTIYELNNWLFDYLYAHNQPIRQLPPLDDWVQSIEDQSYWSIAFPAEDWHIWIRSEPVEF